jgi:hypothetical protein
VGEHPQEVIEVHLVLLAVPALVEEGVDDPVAQRVDGELGDPEEVLPAEVALLLLVQPQEPAVQTLDLPLVESGLLLAAEVRTIDPPSPG